ncbi:hypothetical protein HK098_001166 [Nowakowskiella sp. JEL0407]|nr:hypothetical protein HK098_001166 [Nowakowskiella sp. JEL0407]
MPQDSLLLRALFVLLLAISHAKLSWIFCAHAATITTKIVVVPPWTSKAILATINHQHILMYGGYSTANLSNPYLLTNAMWLYNLQTYEWTRISANNTPGVPLLHDVRGSVFNNTWFIAGRDVSDKRSPITRFFSFRLQNLTSYEWKELNFQNQSVVASVSRFGFISTKIGLYVIGGAVFSPGTATSIGDGGSIFDYSELDLREEPVLPSELHSCSRLDFSDFVWRKCPDYGHVLDVSVAYNLQDNWLLGYGGIPISDSQKVDLMNGCCVNSTLYRKARVGEPWIGTNAFRNDLPSQVSSCVLSYNDGFVIYGGVQISNGVKMYSNELYYLTFPDANLSSHNVTSGMEISENFNPPTWGHTPSCVIVNTTLYLIGPPTPDFQQLNLYTHMQSIRHRVIALDLSEPVMFYVPGEKPNFAVKTVFAVLILVGTVLFMFFARVYFYFKDKSVPYLQIKNKRVIEWGKLREKEQIDAAVEVELNIDGSDLRDGNRKKSVDIT